MKRILISLFLLSLSVCAYAYDLEDLRGRVRGHQRDTDSVNQRWTDATLNGYFNDAQREFVKLTRCVHKSTYTTTVNGTKEYSLPNDWIAGERISYAILPLTSSTTNYKQIDYFTKDGLDTKKSTSWENASSDYPSAYYYTNTDKIGLYPPPSSTYAGANFLKIEYVGYPADMDDDSDVPFDGYYPLYSYHLALVWYVDFLCCADKGEMDTAAVYIGKFQADVDKARAEQADKPDKIGGFAPK